jgi:manganese/zinc/iron transport system ATP- binding protein
MDKNWAIDAEDITIAYHDKPVIWDVDMQVPKGVIMAIIGPNGAGKSTLIKGLLGLIPLTAGEVKVFGESYKKVRKKVGYVPQRTAVDWDFPTTVLDVVLMGTYGRLGWIKDLEKMRLF